MDYKIVAVIGIMLILGGYVALMVFGIKHALMALWEWADKEN